MINIYNAVDQEVFWLDDRLTGGTNAVRLFAVHVATKKEVTINPLPLNNIIDALSWANGLHVCNIIDNVTDNIITSFLIKVNDVISLDLDENPRSPVIGYNKNLTP